MLRNWLTRACLCSLFVVAPFGAAGAADLPLKTPLPAPPVPPAVSWTGCNLNGGYGYGLWNQVQHTEVDGTQTSIDVTNGGRGWLGRLGVGCDYQMGGGFSSWVIGVLGEYDLMSLKGTNEFS